MKQRGIEFTADSSDNEINLIQLGDAKTSCKLGILSDMAAKSEGKGTSKSEGLNPTVIIIVLAIVAVLGGLGYLIMKGKLDLSKLY
jgi:hypothetical protein